ncbi:MAG: SAM-dependent methyltransferase, partial [Burkholderiaceae bacterium]
MEIPPSLTSAVQTHLLQVLAQHRGWIGFDRFMELVLYTPGLGYYARDSGQIGALPATALGAGSDFVTAPVLSPLFGRALAVQVGQALVQTGTREVWEFGAGTGAMADQLLQALGELVDCYTIVDLSGALRQRQRETLQAFADKVRWVDALPASLRGVVLGNEVIDAMPVKLLARCAGVWHERGVAVGPDGALAWQDRPTDLRPPMDIAGNGDYLTEIHPQAEAFMRTLVDRLAQGAVLLIDYGFTEAEYYHPQRAMGTLMCHRAHRMDDRPLLDVGAKDITAHVNFTGLALAAQQAFDAAPETGPWNLLGYTSQARFLINCGIGPMLDAADLPQRVMAQKLLLEHEMGELFKVIAFCRGAP